MLYVANPNGLSNWSEGDAWKIFDWSGVATVTGTFSTHIAPDLPAGLSWDFGSLYTTGTIHVVPEPGRALLLFSALGVLACRRRR